MTSLHGLLGIAAFCLLAWAVSENRRHVPWRPVLAGIALQLLLGVLLFKVPGVGDAFVALNRLVAALQDATRAGTSFVFGYLGGAEAPFSAAKDGRGSGFILAFQALPLVLVIGALSALLHHWRVLVWAVRGAAYCLTRTLGIGGAAGIGTAANIFVGMVEAPLVIRPFLAQIARADLFVLMAAGMATIAGTVMVLYASFIGGVIPGALGHLLAASVMSAPAAIAIAQIMVPPAPGAGAGTEIDRSNLASPYRGAMDAITQGTFEGLKLFLNIIAMLVVLVALVYLANLMLGLLGDVGGAKLSLERILAWIMAPVAWLMGIPWDQAGAAGTLLGIKIVLNELIAYLQFAESAGAPFDARGRIIMTYALCGFANFGSLGIMIGGLAGMVPERRAEIAALGLKSILAGTLAACMTGAVAGMMV